MTNFSLYLPYITILSEKFCFLSGIYWLICEKKVFYIYMYDLKYFTQRQQSCQLLRLSMQPEIVCTVRGQARYYFGPL